MVTTVDHSKLRSLGRRKNRILFCQAAFIVIWLFLISLKGWAQESVSGEVIAGEKGYELSIEVVNWKDVKCSTSVDSFLYVVK